MNQPFAQTDSKPIRAALSVLAITAVLLATCQLWAQSTSAAPGALAQSAQPQAGATSQSATRADELAQLRNDLNHMESLLGNMSSEIEFLRDQNLQILLRTNAQMWTILIRDLRQQVNRAEQSDRVPPPASESPAPKAKPR